MKKHSWVLGAVLLGCAGQAFAQRGNAPTTDTARQALARKWQKLKPDYVSERNVLFQEVIAGRPDGGPYPFRVTVLIRDYEPGYPANRYYGKTCVARIEREVYTLEPDRFGGWDVQGRMTPEMKDTRCQNNPAAGVSSVPLSTLPSTLAPAGQIVAAQPAAAPSGGPGGVQPGAYQCWGNGQAHTFMNFTVRGGNEYAGGDGKPGTFSFDPSTQRISFRGGSLDGAMPTGFYAIYHVPQGPPVVSFRNPSGNEAVYCEHK